MKNPDQDESHRRRREVRESGDNPDGQAIAEKLYGGLSTESEENGETETGTE